MYLDRPRLTARLAEAESRRLTAVIAGAGYGKTSLLRAWADGVHSCTHAVRTADRDLGRFARALVDVLRARVPGLPSDLVTAAEGPQGPQGDGQETGRAEAYADHLADALGRALVRDLTLILDDLHELTGAAGPIALVDGLARQAGPTLHLVVASRDELPFPVERLRGQGHYGELVGAGLAFEPAETAALLDELLDPPDRDVAAALHTATGGWPAAVRVAAEMLQTVEPPQRLARVERLSTVGGPLFRYLSTEALAAGGEPTRALLARLAPFDRIHPGLVVALDGENLDTAAAGERLQQLARGGVWLQTLDEPEWYVIAPLVRSLLLEGAAPAVADLVSGAAWFEHEGRPGLALGALRAAGDDAGVSALLARHGARLLATGRVGDVAEAVMALPPEHRDEHLDLLGAEALQIRGDWEGALAVLQAHAQGDGPISPELAWRLGVVHHMQGALEEAEAAYRRGVVDASDPANEALLLAWRGALAWLRGEADACAELARESLRLAGETGDHAALATAHTVAAMEAALRSDRAGNDAHYLRALDHAGAARDILLTIRIRNNRGSRLMEEGFFDEAMVELNAAIELADLAGYGLFRALALSNRGEVLIGLGRLEEAVRDLEAARDLYQSLGSRMVSYPLAHLGAVYLTRGDRTLARGAYEEAVARSEPAGDLQGLVPALAGLARTLIADDLDEAAQVATRAIELGPVLGHVQALLAAAEVALAQGDPERSVLHAGQAADIARARRDRAGLASALERLAFGAPDRAAEWLDEAAALWTDLRSPIGVHRVALARLQLVDTGTGSPQESARRARQAEELAAELRRVGCRRLAADAAQIAVEHQRQPPELEISSLGGFGLRRAGEPVAVTEWQSRKARDLLKILIARRGSPVPRDQLFDLLWPEEEPAKAARRLSVTLSTLRAVLDPDKAHPPDHWVVADGQALRLERSHAAIDVEDFLAEAERGLGLPAGDPERAAQLARAEAAYVGDFLDEDLYEEWAIPLRERARDTYLGVTRALADHAAATGDRDAAARYHLRVLEHDRYDEGAHLGLVAALAAAGHHGAARRAYRTYVQRMGELDVEAVPYPGAGAHPNIT